MSELADYLAFAHQLADAAAAQSLPLFRNLPQVENKLTGGGFDPVTQADRAAEAAMRAQIEIYYPNHGILGEEFAEKPRRGNEKMQWVLDPIDGTRAFITGLPTWGTLIALNDGAAVQIGLMHQPFIGEAFYACAGGTAQWRRGGSGSGGEKRLKTRACKNLGDAVLATTSPAYFENSPQAKIWQRLAAQARLTRYGGDCYNYALLADGQLDIVVEQGLRAFDIQALIPIIECAGGIVTDWQGKSAINGGQIVACGDPARHAELLDRLNP